MCCAASKPPLGSSRASPRLTQTARSACGLLGSGRPGSARLGSARSSPAGPATPAAGPTLERTASALAQSAPSPGAAAQDTPHQQVSWAGKASKVPSSPFAANIIADTRTVQQAELTLMHTSCSTVPERSDEADQDSTPERDFADEAQSRAPRLQQGDIPALRLGQLSNLPSDSNDTSSDSKLAAGLPGAVSNLAGASSGARSWRASGLKLTGDADEDVRRMLALEGYSSDSSSCSSCNDRCCSMLASHSKGFCIMECT
jgi:hypothetical protein